MRSPTPSPTPPPVSNVALVIGGRRFTVACAPGEESHVAGLGRSIDAKLAAMGEMAGQSETRMLLYAALLLADELHEREAASAAPRPSGAAAEPGEAAAGLGERLSAIAQRLENLADLLEGSEAEG